MPRKSGQPPKDPKPKRPTFVDRAREIAAILVSVGREDLVDARPLRETVNGGSLSDMQGVSDEHKEPKNMKASELEGGLKDKVANAVSPVIDDSLSAVSTAMRIMGAGHQVELDALNKQLEERSTNCHALQTKVDELMDALASSVTTATNATTRVTQLELEMERYRASEARMMKERDEARIEHARLTGQMQETVAKCDSVVGTQRAQQEKINELTAKVISATDAVEKLTNENAAYQASEKQRFQEIATLEAANAALHDAAQKHQNAETELNATRGQLTQMELRVSNLEGAIQAKDEAFKTYREDRTAEFESFKKLSYQSFSMVSPRPPPVAGVKPSGERPSGSGQ